MLPGKARNYSITEMEMCGFTINIASFVHLLKIDFDVIVNHLSLKHIIESKAELTTTRIKRFIRGISDFLSRQKKDNSNPHEIIPISFNMQK